MLDHRVYRVAFIPALVALFVVAFSLTDPAKPRTTTLAPDAFESARTFGIGDPPPRDSLRELVASFPHRRPGSHGDTALADRVATEFRADGFDVRRYGFGARTIDGKTQLEDVIATRQGISSRRIVVVAHRDAPKGPAAADLSGTAVLLELARLLAVRDLDKTVVLASVSGGSGGFDGARRVADLAGGDVDAVIVLGDMASRDARRPFVVPWSTGAAPAPWALTRTAQAALRKELAGNPGRLPATAQWIHRALPLSLSEQGALSGRGLPAILVSASGERRPSANAPISAGRLSAFGRGVLRTLTAALEAGGIQADANDVPAIPAFAGGDGIVTRKRLVPDWAIRLLVLTLLVPALLTALDAFFRARRHGLNVGRWSAWLATLVLAPLLAWLWARALGLVDGVGALAAPTAQGELAITTGDVIAMASTGIVFIGAAFGVRPLLTRRIGPRGDASAGGAAAATGLALSVLVGVVWVANPYAAAVLLPAAHAWLLASAPEARGGRVTRVATVLGGLVLPLAIVAYYAHAWGFGPVEGLWAAYGLVAGGVLGLSQALVLSCFFAALCATVVILHARGRHRAAAPPQQLVTRGPRSYAGPGSLGGTESALRR